MKFLRNVYINFIFEKISSNEAQVTGRVTAITNNLLKQSSTPLHGAINEINCSSDGGSCDSLANSLPEVFQVLNH